MAIDVGAFLVAARVDEMPKAFITMLLNASPMTGRGVLKCNGEGLFLWTYSG